MDNNYEIKRVIDEACMCSDPSRQGKRKVLRPESFPTTNRPTSLEERTAEWCADVMSDAIDVLAYGFDLNHATIEHCELAHDSDTPIPFWRTGFYIINLMIDGKDWYVIPGSSKDAILSGIIMKDGIFYGYFITNEKPKWILLDSDNPVRKSAFRYSVNEKIQLKVKAHSNEYGLDFDGDTRPYACATMLVYQDRIKIGILEWFEYVLHANICDLIFQCKHRNGK